jgi:CelD/BcsL family acetyltransferase involved in cellulose biosynthesis
MSDNGGVRACIAIRTSAATSDGALEHLGREWDELLEDSDQRVFFLRWSWNRLWWRILRPPDSELFIITCRDEQDRLVGLAPLYLRQRYTAGIPHVRELLFLGTGIYAQTSEHLDVIARRGFEQIVAGSVADYLDQNSTWDRLCLTDIPQSSTMLSGLGRALAGDTQIEHCSRSYFVDTTVDWQTFKRRLANSGRNNIGSRTRKLFASHTCKFKSAETTGEFDEAMDALVQLHQARWQSKGEPGAFALPNIEQFLREVSHENLAHGRSRLTTLEIDGKITAARLDFLDNHIAHAFQAGFDPAFTKAAVGAVMNGLCIRTYIEDDSVHKYDFMGGSGDYKEMWTKNHADSVRLTLVRSGTRAAAYKSLERAKAVGKSLLRASVPEPIRIAGHRLITQRHYNRRPEKLQLVGDKRDGKL